MRCLLYILLFILSTPLFSANIYMPQPKNVFIVDDFEDADLKLFPEWWGFDAIELSTEANVQKEHPALGKRSLQLTGSQKKWYVGGAGTYFAQDVRKFNAIKMLIRGFGPKSGVLMVELFDDDNNNFQVEPHPENASETFADDKFIHSVKVDWEGWKVVIIPFDHFVDGNLGFGDDTWNPFQTQTSGGLLQLQLVLLAGDKNKNPRIHIDTIKIYKQGPMPMKKKPKSQAGFDSDFDF